MYVFILYLIGAAVIAFILFGGMTFPTFSVPLMYLLIGFAALYFLFIGILSSALHSILHTALYMYASTNKVPLGYTKQEVVCGTVDRSNR